MKKILITGAHFTPAQAVVEQINRMKSDKSDKVGEIEIVYVGRKTTMEGDKTESVESQVLPKLGVKYLTITSGRLRRYFSWGTFSSLIKIPVGFWQALGILQKSKPNVVLSFGGYVAVPIVFWAWVLKIPVIVHEQTLVLGLANTISAYFATKIAVTFDQDSLPSGSKYDFPKSKLVVTGNPIRQVILNARNEPKKPDTKFTHILNLASKERLPIILVTGGNQGSHLLNKMIGQILPSLLERYVVIHQTGDSKFHDFDLLLEKREGLKNKDRYMLQKFIEASDFAGILAKTSLAISRAGANTLLELSFLGIPTIIVPIPGIHKNEQEINAKYFKQLGLGVVLEQDEITPDKLSGLITVMIKDHLEFHKKAKQAEKIVIPGAAKKIAELVLAYV